MNLDKFSSLTNYILGYFFNKYNPFDLWIYISDIFEIREPERHDVHSLFPRVPH